MGVPSVVIPAVSGVGSSWQVADEVPPHYELGSSAETVLLTSTRILARRNLVEFNQFHSC